MKRREFIAGLSEAATARPLAAARFRRDYPAQYSAILGSISSEGALWSRSPGDR
jgi:hypothetical protein